MTTFFKKSNLQRNLEKMETRIRKKESKRIRQIFTIWRDNSNLLNKLILPPQQINQIK